MRKCSGSKTIGALLPIMAAVIGWWVLMRPSETPIERAHRLCAECGLADHEIDELIELCRHVTLTRKQALQLFLDTYDHPEDRELAKVDCLPCNEAILGAAGVER